MEQQQAKQIITVFVSSLLKKGKKKRANKIILEVLKELKNKVPNKNSFFIISVAVYNVMPLIGIKAIRMGGLTQQIPFPLREKQRLHLGVSSLIKAARLKKRNFANSLSEEIFLAYSKKGNVIKKRNEIHSLGIKGRPFAHYRWF